MSVLNAMYNHGRRHELANSRIFCRFGYTVRDRHLHTYEVTGDTFTGKRLEARRLAFYTEEISRFDGDVPNHGRRIVCRHEHIKPGRIRRTRRRSRCTKLHRHLRQRSKITELPTQMTTPIRKGRLQ